jgi:hypothetical protein
VGLEAAAEVVTEEAREAEATALAVVVRVGRGLVAAATARAAAARAAAATARVAAAREGRGPEAAATDSAVAGSAARALDSEEGAEMADFLAADRLGLVAAEGWGLFPRRPCW